MKTFSSPFRCWLFLILSAVASVETFAQSVATNSPWNRVVMIGASASAGFTVSEPFGGTNSLKCKLSYYCDAALTVPHEPIRNLAQAMFFLQPEAAGRMQVDQAVRLQPTLVVAADFMFWFCYGQGTNDAERAQRFEGGLKLLEAIRCPLVIGDIPDASFATNTGILSPAQVPSGAALSTANQRLKTWASVRSQVVVLPLSLLMRTAMANQALTIHGQTLTAGSTRANLQSDLLHPNPRGAAMLALDILDVLTSKRSDFSAKEVNWDMAEVFQRGVESALKKPGTSSSSAK